MKRAQTTSQFLPPPYYWTPDWLADHWGTHRDYVLALIENGTMNPAALIQKSALPNDYPGLATHIVLVLGETALRWEGMGTERVAQVEGKFRAYMPEWNQNIDITLEKEDAVLISRHDLVVLDSEREDFESRFQAKKPMRSDNRRSIMLALGELAEEPLARFGNRPHSLAKQLSVRLELRGKTLGEAAIAAYLTEAMAVLTEQSIEERAELVEIAA